MRYNTELKKLIIPEYGRHIHEIIDNLCEIKDEKKRNEQAEITIQIMGNLNPHLRDVADFKHKIWDHDSYPEIDVNIGILGYGSLGSDAGKKLKNLGFNVFGYSLNKKNDDNIPLFYGDDLDVFLKKINVLVCTVPYTSKTKNLLSKNLFDKLNNGTYLINVSRGKVQNETDILNAIDKGVLSGAYLDVFINEPLPKNSLMWNNKKIQITPHIASITNEEAAVPQILDNYQRLIDNLSLFNKVNTDSEY